MIEGAAALAIAAVDAAGETNAGDVPARVDAAGAIAGRRDAICRRPNMLRLRIPGRESPSRTNRRLAILSPSFCRVSRSRYLKIAFRPLPRRPQRSMFRLERKLPHRRRRHGLSRTRNCPPGYLVRYLPLRYHRFMKNMKLPLRKCTQKHSPPRRRMLPLRPLLKRKFCAKRT